MAEVGYLSLGALNHVARTLAVPPADVYGVATFYAMFATEPRAPYVVHVCDDVACGPRGGEEVAAGLTEELGPEGEGKEACWVRSPCLGLCERAPAVLLQLAGQPDVSIAPAATADVTAALRTAVEIGHSAHVGMRDTAEIGEGATVDHEAEDIAAIGADHAFADSTVSAPQTPDPALRLLGRVGVVDPESLDDYRAHGGYAALRRAIRLGPSRVIKEVTDSALTGRGGAAFPTGTKWSGVATAPQRPHYLVCNADESEPGTFKDRVLMEHDPFGLIEAMTIAGYATGCERGYLYIRGEYPLATRRLQHAIAAARARGLPRPRRHGRGLRVRHRAAPRRGRLHLRRGDRAAQLDRGLPRRAAQQAAVPERQRPVRASHGDQQRGDALRHLAGARRGRPRVRAGRRRSVDRAEAVLRLRRDRRARACTR